MDVISWLCRLKLVYTNPWRKLFCSLLSSTHVCTFLLGLFVLMVQRLSICLLSENCLLISLYKSSNQKKQPPQQLSSQVILLTVVFVSIQRKQSSGNLNLPCFFIQTGYILKERMDFLTGGADFCEVNVGIYPTEGFLK